ncbi:phage holin family protein [Bacillus chungangensis]|uniref:Toxin secretion/phage lysis holin n=1 Tax=Bacillus chungangensis TaxID=587633 RepID=A0ABT9WUA4_9BACI|nr:phage holin family protein [Bacillus chungangensis]MDQ0176703.1 toxin secretion/phage lysis holin [Bacillus chungangensis]
MLENIVKTVAAASAAAVSFLWGEWSILLKILLAFVIIDYVTGLIASAVEGRLRSKVGLVGIARKVLIFLMVAVANLVDIVLIESGIREEPFLMMAVIVFYIINELLSITENGGRIGLPIPSQIRQAIEMLNQKEVKK